MNKLFFYFSSVFYYFYLISNPFRYEKCYGLMHIPRSMGANDNNSGSSVDHFIAGISKLTGLTSQLSATFQSFTATEQTRAGLAAYDNGISCVQHRGILFFESFSTNFSRTY